MPEFVVFKNGAKIDSLVQDNPKKAKTLFDKYNTETTNKSVESKNDANKDRVSKNASKSNLTQNDAQKVVSKHMSKEANSNIFSSFFFRIDCQAFVYT